MYIILSYFLFLFQKNIEIGPHFREKSHFMPFFTFFFSCLGQILGGVILPYRLGILLPSVDTGAPSCYFVGL